MQRYLRINDVKILNFIRQNKLFPVSAKDVLDNFGILDEKHKVNDEWSSAEKQIEKTINSGIQPISFFDDIYPFYLKITKNPPPILYLKGNLDILNDLPGVAIVGSRKATEKGAEIARRIAHYMASMGWSVISGLALGIDAAAHLGTLQANGKTIAVLAHGLHVANPKKNEKLGFEILEKGGAWVSEHPVGVPPKREYFVPRNRIQVGLSAGSVIVESDIKSGSMTQANFCLEQNRRLFAVVPENDTNKLGLLCDGTQMLVRDRGAIPLRTKEDYPTLLLKLKEKASELKGGL